MCFKLFDMKDELNTAYLRQIRTVMVLAVIVLALFVLLMPWIPQQFSALTLPLALVLLTRPVSYLINYNRR